MKGKVETKVGDVAVNCITLITEAEKPDEIIQGESHEVPIFRGQEKGRNQHDQTYGRRTKLYQALKVKSGRVFQNE